MGWIGGHYGELNEAEKRKEKYKTKFEQKLLKNSF
jgi:hypothetical protein